VCVETLKRDWDSKLTLRDVLVTICCLLIQPNPDSALNAEAGSLIQEGFEVFERRARLMTGINAGVPKALAEVVREAQTRGQEDEHESAHEQSSSEEDEALEDSMCRPAIPAPVPAPMRRRRGVARLRSAAASRRSESSPSGAIGTRRHQLQQHAQPGPSSSRPFITQGSNSNGSDPFGISIREDPPISTPQIDSSSDNESEASADQENDVALSPFKPRETHSRPLAGTPRRPHGAPPVPLGELSLEDASPPASPAPSEPADDDDASSLEEEYPPSPRKSPTKSPAKKIPQPNLFFGGKPQRTAALFGPGARNFTPPNSFAAPLASDSPYTGQTPVIDDDTTMTNPTPSPRKARPAGVGLFGTPAAKRGNDPAARNLFGRPAAGPSLFSMSKVNGKGVHKAPSPPSSAEKRKQRDKKLWELCGGDVKKWNRGEFGSEEGFEMKAARW
jgi:ubiquitin-conjugating enzyme E2 S